MISAHATSRSLPRGERAGRAEEARPVELGIGRGRAAHLLHPHAQRQIERVVDRRDQPLDVAAVRVSRAPSRSRSSRSAFRPSASVASPEQHREAAKRGADVGAAARQDLGLRRAQQIRGAARIEHLEMGRHPGLQRKRLRSD